MPRPRILIVDDEENIGRSLRLILEREGYDVALANCAQQFRTMEQTADVFLFDVRLPDASGVDLLRELRRGNPSAPVLMISGQATIAEAVEATRLGAFDFLEKPLSRERVLVAIKNALANSTLLEENARLKDRLKEASAANRMVVASPVFRNTIEQATLAARTDARVLLIGESGTGKEMLAAHVHQSSRVASGPFVKVNCAAIPTELIESELFGHEKGAFTGAAQLRRGKFEQADGGTLFLDEVGDLHSGSQAKLLRVLQEGEFHRLGGEHSVKVNVRVIAATNQDLSQLVAQQRFREDLFYRLAVVPIRVPALRERPEDIHPMARYFLDEFCVRNNFRPKSISPEVTAVFESHHWPGNARELRNIVERMAILSPGDVLNENSIPVEIRVSRDHPPKNTLEAACQGVEREHILRALDHARWNVSQAARALGLERTNLHKRIRALGLSRH